MARLQRVSLDPVLGIVLLIADNASPVTAGYQAPIGSLYISSASGEAFRKTGSAASNWSALGSSTALLFPVQFYFGDAQSPPFVGSELEVEFPWAAGVSLLGAWRTHGRDLTTGTATIVIEKVARGGGTTAIDTITIGAGGAVEEASGTLASAPIALAQYDRVVARLTAFTGFTRLGLSLDAQAS